MKTDSQILHDVLNELRWDHKVGEAKVGVEVDAGVVTLSGNVPTYAMKVAAREAVHRVKGVLDVANGIEVIQPDDLKHSDTAIAGAVRGALKWNSLVPDHQIHTTVEDGWVTLAGTVHSVGERIDAEDAIRDIEGVRGVSNTILVEPRPVDSIKVKTSIEQALERRAESEAEAISVTVHDHQVTLSGRVHSWPERHAVLDAASQAPGIRGVVDHLRIDPNF